MPSILETLSQDRKRAHERLLDLKSPVYAAFLGLEQATYADGALPKVAKELIAVGISVVINCQSCMREEISGWCREAESKKVKIHVKQLYARSGKRQD